MNTRLTKFYKRVVNKIPKTRRYYYLTTFRITLTLLSATLAFFLLLFIFPQLPISRGPLAQAQAYMYASRKIVEFALFREDARYPGETPSDIVRNIVAARVQNQYLYTGGHYQQFYIRNLGTFANKMVEPAAARDFNEWHKRLDLMMRSTELALDVFSDYDEITTTIVQLRNGKYVPINIYVKPSDSLPSLLKILEQLRRVSYNPADFPISQEERLKLVEIENRANRAIARFSPFLQEQSRLYIYENTDPKTHLIKKDIALSGIKDAWIRKSSLYDNVMLWSVYEYNHRLGLHPEWEEEADVIKAKLIERYWDETHGIFYDEDPAEIKKNYFSADNMITYEMDMLSMNVAEERKMLERIVQYIEAKNLDEPFPLKTTEVRIPHKEHLPVRMFAPNYIGTTIWSYWGMTYIDVLHQLGELEGNEAYKVEAQRHLEAYGRNIEKYRGYPELYTPEGETYESIMYRSVNDMVWGIYYLYLENKLE